MSKQPKVAVIMGSDSDFQALKGCIKFLKEYGVEVDVNVISAHRTPEAAEAFAKGASDNGFDLIIAAAARRHICPACWRPIRRCRLSAFPSKHRLWTGWTLCLPLCRCRKVFRLPQLRSMALTTRRFWRCRFCPWAILI